MSAVQPWINPAVKEAMLQALGTAAEAGVGTAKLDVYSKTQLLLSIPLINNVFQNAELDLVRSSLAVALVTVAVASGVIDHTRLFARDGSEIVRSALHPNAPTDKIVVGVGYRISALSIHMADTGVLTVYTFVLPTTHP